MSAIAHAGMDAILLFVENRNRTQVGYGDAEHIRWKIRQVTYVLEKELPDHRRVIDKFCT